MVRRVSPAAPQTTSTIGRALPCFPNENFQPIFMKTNRKPILYIIVGSFAIAAISNSSGQPVIIRPPANQTASLFADATFQVSATGGTPLSFQWRLNGGDLIGMTNWSLRIKGVQRSDAGRYQIVVTNPSGSVTSQVATLTITPFNSIYFFGFSWTDTHNCPWDPVQYWHNHACNGPMWPEFLSTNLGLAYLQENNYAHCGAKPLDILNQCVAYPIPGKPELSLYCLWGDSPDYFPLTSLINALTNETAGNQLLQSTLSIDSSSVNRLYAKGAKTILILVDNGGSTNGLNGNLFGTNTWLLPKLYDFYSRWRASYLDQMNRFIQAHPDVRVLLVDMLTPFDDVLVHPAQYGFTRADIDALDDSTLTDKSFTGPGADYVFWDPNHGTSKLNQLIAAWNFETLTSSRPETLSLAFANSSLVIRMDHLQIGRDYTLQKSKYLSNWSDVQTFTASAGTNLWTGPVNGVTTEFYRLKWQQ
jgi:hypothetical protein